MATQMTEDANIRLTLAVNLKDRPLDEVKEIYKWITEQKSGIVPVSNFQVVKQ